MNIFRKCSFSFEILSSNWKIGPILLEFWLFFDDCSHTCDLDLNLRGTKCAKKSISKKYYQRAVMSEYRFIVLNNVEYDEFG